LSLLFPINALYPKNENLNSVPFRKSKIKIKKKNRKQKTGFIPIL
jgi:hypothetical protein